MKKKSENYYLENFPDSKKLFSTKKLLIALILLCNLNLYSSTYSSSTKLSINLKKATLNEVFNCLIEQSEFEFVYNDEEVAQVQNVEVEFTNVNIEKILDKVLEDYDLSYQVVNNVVVIKPSPPATPQEEKKGNVVKGTVKDEFGNAMIGVTIHNPKSLLGTSTNEEGKYVLPLHSNTTIITFSFIGYKSQEVEVNKTQELNIILVPEATEFDDFVVTGIIQINKESFTGTATTVKGEELMAMGTDNAIKSLALMDPSFNIIENNLYGSNPNSLPEINLRGNAILNTNDTELNRTSLSSDPNQPVFILDDFETTLTQVMDMDMNRIESITILKDAAATAMYGSRAANGVVVIKTKQPEIGKLQISYNQNTIFSFPDLGSYDVLNASELFGLQKDLGLFDYYHEAETGVHKVTTIEKHIAQGVDTDWLAQPTRNTVGQKHSLNLMGGDEHMRYMLDLNYSNTPGVMKESGRENIGMALTLNYKLNEKLTFKNRLAVNKNKAENSPYGSFDYYTKMPSYLPVNYANGALIEQYEIPVYDTDETGYFSNYNPMYEAQVGNIDTEKYVNITNNFAMDWKITPSLKLKTNFAYTYNNTKTEEFTSPDSYIYWSVDDPEEQGYYSYNDIVTESYYGNAILNYTKNLGNHFINGALGLNISEESSELLGFSAQGFAASSNYNPAFANSYGIGDIPESYEETVRLIGGLASVNYSYDNRYLADFTYRLDGSSQFGSDDKTAGFYSAGLGWNLHNEAFLENQDVLSLLKLKGTYGETGSVNFSAYQAKDVLQYYTDVRYLDGLGTYIAALGNENLTWQTTTTLDLGVEFGLFNQRVSGSINYYNKLTTDMIIDVTTPPSVGFETFSENLGKMENKGVEFALRAKIINKKDFKLNVFATGYHNESKILGIGNSLESYNDLSDQGGYTDEELLEYEEVYGSTDDLISEASHSFFVHYEEGESNTAIYAVQSLGIDPMTGQEIFLSADGTPTLEWDADDKVVVGDTEAKLSGNFGTNIAYGPFELGLTFAYRMGGQAYNYTLVDKVENSNKYYNVDRRVLEETWMEPGDVVKYKTNVLSWGNMSYTPASDRFVQDYNYLKLSSINLSYNLPKSVYSQLKMESLRLSFNMSDIFTWSTVNMERGTLYPYARSFTLSLRANF